MQRRRAPPGTRWTAADDDSNRLTLSITPVALPALSNSARCEATLLFADLFGYSAFTEEREIEQVASVIGEIKRHAVKIVHAHGGIVNQFVGDEVMAIFGFPKGAEDAPRRAIEAALELHEFVRCSDLRQWLGPDKQLRMHSGIDAGMVLVRTRDVRNGLFELTGSAVIRAARLRSAAAADELLISHRVQARVADRFQTEPLRAQRFKGSREAATPFRVLRSSVPEPRPRPARLVSARSELSQLQRFWAQRTAQRGGVVIVEGVAGSGKSRLLERFAQQLEPEGVAVWTTRGRDRDCEPFSALARMTARMQQHPLAPRSNAEPPSPPALWDWQQVSRELAGEGPERRRMRGQSAPHPTRFLRAVSGLLGARVEASTNRHAFVVDDLQWIDPSSLAVLAQLASRLCPQGVVFVCAVRDAEHSSHLLQRLRGAVPDELCATIRLGPLSLDDTNELVAEHLELQRPSGHELIDRLALLSDGTPLNLVELLNLLMQDRCLHAHDGDWKLDSSQLDGLRLAPSAQGLIERRLRALSPDAAKLLRAAAIMRDGVDVPRLARVTRLHQNRAARAVREALGARLVELGDNGQVRFAHDVIWEVVLLGMTAEEQRSWHRRAAQALRASPEMDPRHRFALARHSAAGLLEEDPGGTFESLRHAARLALQAYDDALALSFLRPAMQAAELAGFDPGPDFYAELAETAFRLGELDSAFDAFERAAEQLSSGLERAHLLGRMAWIQHYRATGSPAHMLEQALRECGEQVPRFSLTALLSAAKLRAERSLRSGTADLSQRRVEIVSGLYLGLCRIYADNGQSIRALAACTRLSVVAEGLPPCRLRSQADAMLGFFLGVLGAHSLSRQRLARCRSAAERLDDPVALAYYHQLSHVLAMHQGRFEEAEHHAHECVMVRGHHIELSELCLICMSQYSADLYRGRIDRALSWAAHAIGRVQQLGHAPAVFALIEEAVCGVWVSHGMHDEVVRLKSRLRFVERTELGRGGYYHQASFQCRLPYVSGGQVPNPAFEALVADFERLGLNPKRLGMGALPFYVQVAHVRMTQCLRTQGRQRRSYRAKLHKALADVKASVRLPLMQAHCKVLEAALRLVEDRPAQTEPLLLEAEALARTFGLPWVSCAAARVRAHMLRAQGRRDAARDEARVAALHASQYGQRDLQTLIAEEFALDLAAQPAH